MTGYSGTPLARKLGISADCTLCVRGSPKPYAGLVAPLPAGVRIESRVTSRTDIVHVFSKSRTRLRADLAAARELMRDDAAIWVSWPKKASGVATDVTEDVVRALALPMGLVDVKVCAVDETWSGLKLVVRKESRASGGESPGR